MEQNWISSQLPDNNQLISFEGLSRDDDNFNQSFTPEVKWNYNNPSGLTQSEQKSVGDLYNMIMRPPRDDFLSTQLSQINQETNINLSQPSLDDFDILKTINVNKELKNNNFAGAELILGRNLDDEEIMRQSITAERQYLKPPSRLERLIEQSFIFDKSNKDEIAELLKSLNDLKIVYKINDRGDSVEIQTGSKKTAPIMPRPVVTEERETEIYTQPPLMGWKKAYLSSIKLPSTKWKSEITKMTDTYEELKKYADDIGITSLQPRTDFKNNKEYLGYIRKEIKSFVQSKLDNPPQEEPLQKIEGSGLKRAFRQPPRQKNDLIPFGKYFLDATLFNKKGWIQLRTEKRNPVYKMGRVMASKQFNDVLKKFIKNNGEIQMDTFKKLSKPEQDIFTKVLDIADVQYTFSNRKEPSQQKSLNNDAELKRDFMESYGSFKNGNNSPQLVEKINGLLDIMADRGLVSKKDLLKLQHSLFGGKI